MLCEVEVLDDDRSGAVDVCEREDLRHGVSRPCVTGEGGQAVQGEGDRVRDAEGIAAAVEHSEREMPDVHVDGDHRSPP